jgi:ArsR family transcriptional regulator
MRRSATYLPVFKALADPTRLRILEMLKSRGKSSCALVGRDEKGLCAFDVGEQAGLSQSVVAHHMAILVSAGLVRANKRSRFVFYSRNEQVIAEAGDAIARLI